MMCTCFSLWDLHDLNLTHNISISAEKDLVDIDHDLPYVKPSSTSKAAHANFVYFLAHLDLPNDNHIASPRENHERHCKPDWSPRGFDRQVERTRLRHDVTLLTQRRRHTRIPNKRLRQLGSHHPRLSPQGLYQLLRHCSNPRTRIHEDVYLISRRRTGNRKTPHGVLHQCLQMRFGVHLIHARIARPSELQD